MTYTLIYTDLDGNKTEFQIEEGMNLRKALQAAGISPYTPFTRRANCGGNGICATCGVWIKSGDSAPKHWHDKLANRFGYPRLSCQVSVEADMQVEQVEKWIWGKRK